MYSTGRRYLSLDAGDLSILCFKLIADVQGHALQIPDDAAHVSQVLLHLVLAGVVSHPDTGGSKAGKHQRCEDKCAFVRV